MYRIVRRQAEKPANDIDGLEALVKHVEISSEGGSAQTHLPRSVSPAVPAVAVPAVPAVPAVALAAAAAPPAAPSGLLQVNRPVVLLGKAAEASTSVPSSGRLQTRLNVCAYLCWTGTVYAELLTIASLLAGDVERNRRLRRLALRKRRAWVPPSCRPAVTTLTSTIFLSRFVKSSTCRRNAVPGLTVVASCHAEPAGTRGTRPFGDEAD